MDSKKNMAKIGGHQIEIVKNSKFKGTEPSKEMGFDIEPTATKPNMGSTADIEPTSSMAGLGKQLRDPRDFPSDAKSDMNPKFPVDE